MIPLHLTNWWELKTITEGIAAAGASVGVAQILLGSSVNQGGNFFIGSLCVLLDMSQCQWIGKRCDA